MSEEQENNNQPKQYSPASPEELKEMAQSIPADDKSIFDAFGESASSIPSVIGGFIALTDKDKFAILQRSNIDDEEINVVIKLMAKAEHGIGGGDLDRPMPYIAERVKRYLEAKLSITDDKTGHGMSRQEAVDALSQWTRVIEARDAELKKQTNKGVAG
jgi:hypothetical protein